MAAAETLGWLVLGGALASLATRGATRHLKLGAAAGLTLVSGFTVVVVIRAIVMFAEGAKDGGAFWPTMALLCGYAMWTGRAAHHGWMGAATARRGRR